ncbi:MAG TPA: DPP IV N-terminal domain-containing protein [Candidatus Polarisedimenticolaceae bacterium]
MLALAGLLLAVGAQIGTGAPQPITGIENAFPAWSPDGSKIVFQSNRTGEWHLYLMNPDGSGVRDLTPTLSDCRNPSFSPDGSRIVFYSAMSGNDEIYLMHADGGGVRAVTQHPARDIHPHWSPDGAKIVFNSLRDDPRAFDVYVMNADGTGVTRLTETREDETCATFSPDGKGVVFLRGFQNGNDDILLSGADLREGTNLSASPHANEGWPSFSPDGRRILFSSNRTGVMVVYVVNVDGTELRALTDGMATGEDARAVWSPDGTRIAFTRRRGRSMDIWVMPVSG